MTQTLPPGTGRPDPVDCSALPEPVLDDSPALVELYFAAWRLAAEHVVTRAGVPRSPYMDEGFDPDTIWIWDTCFMAHFCKYAPAMFPGIESLDNFYSPMYDGRPTTLRIHHPDNPPLFAWTEEEYVRHTGDLERVARILDRGYLQRHYDFFDTAAPGTGYPFSNIPTTVHRSDRGYRWDGVCSGMDNTPRAPIAGEHGTSGDILWFDAAAQQALAARSIARLAAMVGDRATAEDYAARHGRLRVLLDDYWDDDDGIFYDRFASAPYDYHRVRTPAAYWPLLAGACDAGRARALADKLTDPNCFGGAVPWPSVARDDPAFEPGGRYWRGGVWIPTAYVSARALTEHGYHRLAHDASYALLSQMARTYAEYRPHTIWEAYSPTRPAPATAKDGREIVRPDFCGWSALAPITMLIECVLGFRVDALTNTITWRRMRPGRTGVRRLACGRTTATIIADGDRMTVETTGALTLRVNGQTWQLAAGRHRLAAPAHHPGG